MQDSKTPRVKLPTLLALPRAPHFTICTSHVTPPHIASRHESHVTHHTTRDIRHTSHVTRHAGTHFTSSDFAAVSETYVPVVQLLHIVDRCVCACLRVCPPVCHANFRLPHSVHVSLLKIDAQVRLHTVPRGNRSTIEALFGIRHTSDVE